MIANHRETLEIRDRWGAMIVQRLGLGMLLGLACLVACQALPDSGTCGNGIAETNLHEDCDGTATLPGTVCNAQCHFSCAASNVNGGSPPKCPGGYFCGSDGTCRSPSGDFGALASQLQSAAYRVDLADVDGDGLKDLIATPPGLTRIQFFNGTSFGEFFDIPNASGAAPIVGRVSQTSIQDLLFPVGPIAVWQGRTDRTLEAISYPTLAFDGSSDGLRVVFADTHAVIDNAPASGEETYFFAPTPGAAATESSSISIDVAGTMVPLQSLRVSSENIAGEVQVGPLVTGGCPNALVYAFARNSVGAGGTPGVEVFDPCQALPGGVLPAPGASPAPPLPVVRFPAVPGRPNARYVVGNKGVLLVDFDGDGRLDVLIHTEIDTTLDDDRQPKIFLAYGTGDGHFQSTPPSDHATDDGLAAELDPALRSQLGPPNLDVFPLAAGQITKSSGDNLCDFVLSDRILLRSNTLQSGGATFSASIQSPPNTLWQTAKIGNFNGDDLPDIAAGSSGGFDFYAGTKLPLVMTPYNATVLNGAAHLATGDFDGDGTTDIAFSSGTEMSVAFGKAGGGPGAPVSMGRFSSEIQHVSAGPFPIPNRQSDGLADIAVLGKKSGDSTSQVLSVLLGSVSRQLISPFQLHVQAATNNDRVPALMSAVGAFQVHSDPAAAADVAAFASQRPGTTEDVSMWKIPISPEGQVMTDGVTASALSIPGYTRTVVNGETSSTVHTLRLGAAAMGAVDLDSTKNDALDALDELVMVIPPQQIVGDSDTTTAGRLAIMKLGGAGTWATQTLSDLGGGAGSGQENFLWKVRVIDIDDDKKKDIVVLFDEHGHSKLQVYFNDQTGTLGTPISVADDLQIIDCAWLHANPVPASQYANDLVILATKPSPDGGVGAGLYLVHSDSKTRTFSASREVTAVDVPGGTTSSNFQGSIAAGDLDGDGVDDVIVATGSRLLVFKGTPR